MSTSPIAGSRIVDINFPEGVIVGGILKDGEMLSQIVVQKLRRRCNSFICTFKDIPEVERLLQVTIDYF